MTESVPGRITCPDCNGSGTIVASHVHYADGRGKWNVPMRCPRCGGEGKCPAETLDWMRRGRALRDRRVNGEPYRSMREVASLAGLDVVAVSRMEHGRCDPAPLAAWWEGQG